MSRVVRPRAVAMLFGRNVAFFYIASVFIPGTAAQLANAACTPITVDFIVKDNDPQVAAVEDDIARDLAQIGITLNTRSLNASAYREAELAGDYHMLFTRTWGAPYDPHSYMTSWAVPAHAEYSAIGGLEPPLTREGLLQMISDVQVQSDPQIIAERWQAVLSAIHQQASARAVSAPHPRATRRRSLTCRCAEGPQLTSLWDPCARAQSSYLCGARVSRLCSTVVSVVFLRPLRPTRIHLVLSGSSLALTT